MTVSEHLYTVTIGGTTLPVTGGEISLDVSRAPLVQGVIEFGMPDASLLALTDPRTSPAPRVEVTCSAGIPRTFDLHVRGRTVTHGDGACTLTLASDEGLLADYAPLADDTTPLLHEASLRALVAYVLDTAIRGATLQPGDADADFTGRLPELFTWKAGQSAIAFLQTLLQSQGLRLVCDEERQWTLRDEAWESPGTLALREPVNIHTAGETISRDTGLWRDAHVTRYRWSDASGAQQEEVDAYALVTPWSRLTLLEVDGVYPGPGRSEYIVRRAQGVGREVTVSTTSNWAADAEQPLQIIINGVPAQVGKVQSLSFDLSDDTMTVTARTTDTPAGAINLLLGTIDALPGTIDAL